MSPELPIFCLCLLIGRFRDSFAQDSYHYLQNAVTDIRNKLGSFSNRRFDHQVLSPSSEKESSSFESVPSLSLTKGELAALYETALHKHQGISADHDPLNFVVDEPPSHHKPGTPLHMPQPHSGDDEYYYYYYPLDSFLDHPHKQVHADSHPSLPSNPVHTQYHNHTHQHNVHITKDGQVETDKKKHMEPLFMAVSSFVGMAVMFILSIIFLPRFGILKSRGSKGTTSSEITGLTDLVLRSIQGEDCSERLACEFGKRAKRYKMHNNRFLKLFKRMSPSSIRWYLNGISRYSGPNVNCTTIKCSTRNVTKHKAAKLR